MKEHFVVAIYASKQSADRFYKLAQCIHYSPSILARELLAEGISSRRKTDPKFDLFYKTIYQKKRIGKGA